MAGQWWERPVFVSSTFQDMHAERDHLQRVVFPELQERLLARNHDLVPIDLRWGVGVPDGTDEGSDQAAIELEVLKVCLAEIERSRPFFLGLLGDRYGWVADADRLARAADEAGLAADLTGRSITAIEIEHGALASAARQGRARFYFRSPLPYETMPPALAARYADAWSPSPEIRAAAEKLDALKVLIERTMPDRVRRYEATWDPVRQGVGGLDDFGAMVLEDLWSELDDETAAFVRVGATTWQQAERDALERVVETRTRFFVGHDALVDDLMGQATGPTEPGVESVVVVGESGSGKSTIFSALHRRLRGEPEVLVLANSAGATPRSQVADSVLARWIDEVANHLGVPPPDVAETDSAELERLFARLLVRACEAFRVVVLLDALDQLEPTERSRGLTWLPALWPTNARLIATTRPGPSVGDIEQRRGARVRELPPLSEDAARQLLGAASERLGRALPAAVTDALMAKRTASGAMAAGNPLWLNLAFDELVLLDESHYLAPRSSGAMAADDVVALLVETVDRLPASPDQAYVTLLQRTEAAYGERWARSFAELLAVSRSGWREADLRVLVPQVSGEAWNELTFARLRRGFRSHVLQRSEGRWDFTHALARSAVLDRGLTTPAPRLHAAIVAHLEALPAGDPQQVAELAHHLIGAGDTEAFARHLASPLSTEALTAAIASLRAHLVSGGPPATAWLRTMLTAVPGFDRGPLIDRLLDDVLPALADSVSLATQIELTRSVLEAIEQSEEELTARTRRLVRCLRRLARQYRAASGFPAAEATYARAIEVAEQAFVDQPEHLEVALELFELNDEAGDLLADESVKVFDRGRGAMERYQRAHQVIAGVAPGHRDDPRVLRALSTSHENLAFVGRPRPGPVAAVGPDAWSAVIADLEAAIAAAERLHAFEPNDPDAHRLRIEARAGLAATLGLAGRHVEARAEWVRALELARAAYLAFPEDLTLRRLLVNISGAIGGAEVGLGHAEAAFRDLPESLMLGRLVAAWHLQSARLAADGHEAIAHCRRATDLVGWLRTRVPDDADLDALLYEAHRMAGIFAPSARERAAARVAAQRFTSRASTVRGVRGMRSRLVLRGAFSTVVGVVAFIAATAVVLVIGNLVFDWDQSTDPPPRVPVVTAPTIPTFTQPVIPTVPTFDPPDTLAPPLTLPPP